MIQFAAYWLKHKTKRYLNTLVTGSKVTAAEQEEEITNSEEDDGSVSSDTF